MSNPCRCRLVSGFTLIELMVVVIIIGILSVASVPIYRNYIRRAAISEGRSIAGSIATGERIYYVDYLTTISTGTASVPVTGSAALGMDISANKFFNHFYVTASGGPGPSSTFTGYILGDNGQPLASGITVTVIQAISSYATVIDNL